MHSLYTAHFTILTAGRIGSVCVRDAFSKKKTMTVFVKM